MRRYTTLLLTAFLLLAIVIAGSAYLAGSGHIDRRTRVQELTVLTTLPAEEADILSQAYEDSSGVHVTFVPLSSADVLDRIAHALLLNEVEREHLFLLGLGRPPEARYRAAEGITPRLQRVLDALEPGLAIIRTATWDVVAWNRATAVMLTDYSLLPPGQRNVLRLLFGDPRVRAAQDDWEGVARFVVGSFRADAARAGAVEEVRALAEELCRTSPEFAAMWRDNDVRSHGEGLKHLRHPVLGRITLELSSFAVDGRPDLWLLVHNPVLPADRERIRALIEAPRAAAPG